MFVRFNPLTSGVKLTYPHDSWDEPPSGYALYWDDGFYDDPSGDCSGMVSWWGLHHFWGILGLIPNSS